MSDWDASEDEAPAAKIAPATTSATPITLAPPVAYKSRRFEGEDEEEEGDSDWDVSDSEKKKSANVSGTSTPSAPTKKKRNLKTVLAEKEAKAALKKAQGDDLMDEETPQEKRRREKAQQEEAEAAAAADFLGADSTASVGQATDLTSANPKTKDDFIKLAQSVAATIFERLHDKPLYSAFAEEIARQAVAPLKDVDTRKIGSAITAVASEKTKMAKDQASGKKKAVKKPALGATKRINDADTTAYDEALDDDLDFM